jgi:hypothetical protein
MGLAENNEYRRIPSTYTRAPFMGEREEWKRLCPKIICKGRNINGA